MKTNKLVSLVLLFMGLSTHAAPTSDHGMGNGGDAVVCYTDATRSTITSVQMFDYWEQEQVVKYGKVYLGAASLSVQDKIQIAINRIAKFDPELAEKIKFNALNLANNIQNYLVTSYQLPEINDANPQVIPTQKNCFIEQYGVQYKDVITGQRRFAIADKFYNFSGTSNDEKAGLLLHEAIYRYGILQNSALNNSDGVRYFNYVIASSKINSLELFDIEPYVKMLKIAGILPSDCVLVKGIYSLKGETKSYFNQTIRLGSQIEVQLPRNADFGQNSSDEIYFRKSQGGWDDSKIPSIIFTIIDKSGFKNSFATDYAFSVKQSASESFIDFNYASALPGSQLKVYLGPLNRTYSCYGGKYDLATESMRDCYTSDEINYNGEKYKFNHISSVVPGQWIVYNNNFSKFNVLGSTKKLQIIPYRDYQLNSHIVVDNSLNIIEANIDTDGPYEVIKANQSFPINVNGNNLFIGEHMIVSFINGQYTLKFTTAKQIYRDPKLRNLRLTDTDDTPYAHNQYASANFCKKMGLNGGGEYDSETKYIDSNAEQFYDLATDQIIYKTDENVRIINYMTCNPYEVTVTDY